MTLWLCKRQAPAAAVKTRSEYAASSTTGAANGGVLARTLLAGSCGFNEDGKDLRYLGGTAGGLALVAIGSWAARGRAARRFPNGRGLWVEFQEGSRLLCVGNVYGPSGASDRVHEEWRQTITEERDEAEARGFSTILLGDFNCRRDPNEAGAQPSADIDAWCSSEEIVDVWRTRHRTLDGYKRQALDDRNAQDQSVTDGAEQRVVHGIEQDRQLSRSRIDYIGLPCALRRFCCGGVVRLVYE